MAIEPSTILSILGVTETTVGCRATSPLPTPAAAKNSTKVYKSAQIA